MAKSKPPYRAVKYVQKMGAATSPSPLIPSALICLPPPNRL